MLTATTPKGRTVTVLITRQGTTGWGAQLAFGGLPVAGAWNHGPTMAEALDVADKYIDACGLRLDPEDK